MMHSIYANSPVVQPLVDTDRAVLRAAARMLPAWVRRDRCKRLLRRKFYREMLRCHAAAQSGAWQTWH